MPFTHTLTARFYEIDRAGIVFFGRFYEWAHECFEELLRALFGHPEAMFGELGFGMPLVHSEADYKMPVRFGDRLSVSATVSRISERSATFTYVFSGTDDGIHRATVTLVHAFVDLASFRGIPVPQRFRDAIAQAGLEPSAA